MQDIRHDLQHTDRRVYYGEEEADGGRIDSNSKGELPHGSIVITGRQRSPSASSSVSSALVMNQSAARQ